MLLDCGDHAAINRGRLAVPVLPNGKLHAGEWIARYVKRVNPNGDKVDYLVPSHFHSDHCGCETFHAGKTQGRGEDYFLSGYAQAAETLRFARAVDRGWPGYDDPLPFYDSERRGCRDNMLRLYRHLEKRDGLKCEKFIVGSKSQFRPLRDASLAPGFTVENICGNGKIALPDGSIKDLYADYIRRTRAKWVGENGMSTGMIFRYGKFSLFAAGDFSAWLKNADGSRYDIEEELVAAIGRPVSVAKVNHHGHHSMPAKLVKALAPRVWFSCVWDQLHDTADTLANLSDRSIYPGERTIAPGIMPAERRWEDLGRPWMGDIPKETYEGAHLVFDVPPGGDSYSLSFITADDESMKVRAVMHF
jgi:hypothetical protein